MLFFPRDVLDEICDLTESVSEGFATYSKTKQLTELTTLKIRSKRNYQLNRPDLTQPGMGVSNQPPMLLLS